MNEWAPTKAADALLAAVDPAAPDNAYVPAFATQSLEWLTIILLERLENTTCTKHPDGVRRRPRTHRGPHPQRRFAEFLASEAGEAGTFTRRQRNDFVIGLGARVGSSTQSAFRGSCRCDSRRAGRRGTAGVAYAISKRYGPFVRVPSPSIRTSFAWMTHYGLVAIGRTASL